MQVQRQPDAAQKLERMGNVTFFEPAGEPGVREKRVPRQHKSLYDCVSQVQTPKGPMPVLKTMLTTACERNCYYCPFRAGRSTAPRYTFRPEEMAKTFDEMARARLVDGLFLSSGIIKGSVTTQDKLIDTIDIVRRKYGYRGYIHVKVMPGAEEDQLLRSMQLADRVSVNLEGPTPQRLGALAPKKEFHRELLSLLQTASRFRRERHERLASLVTQFVVGAVGDTDLELLSLGERLYNQLGLARTYFSAFHPVSNTPFENLPPTPLQREFRLYQSSFLLRDYEWDVEELPFVDQGNLRLDVDPKRAWAEENLREAPLDLMKAERTQLLRVPGIGPKGVQAVLRARRGDAAARPVAVAGAGHPRAGAAGALRAARRSTAAATAAVVLRDNRAALTLNPSPSGRGTLSSVVRATHLTVAGPRAQSSLS